MAFPAIARLRGAVLLPPDWRYEENFPQPTPQTLLLCPTTTVLLASSITRGVQALLASGQAGSTELGEIMGVWKACPMGEKCPNPYQPSLSSRPPAGPGAPFYAEQGLTRVNPMEQRPEWPFPASSPYPLGTISQPLGYCSSHEMASRSLPGPIPSLRAPYCHRPAQELPAAPTALL